MKNYFRKGDVVGMVAPVGGAVSGVPFRVGKIFGVPTKNADAGEVVQCQRNGVFGLTKKTGVAFAQGAELYWDEDDKEVTDVAADGVSFGYADAAAAEGDATVDAYVFGFAFEVVDPGAITLAMLADGILAASAGGRAKMADGFITVAKLADGVLTADATGLAKMADGFFAASAGARAKFANLFLTRAKAAVFISTEQTGTGAEQDIAHGLGAAPTGGVIIMPTELPADLAAGYDAALGVHDATNVKATVTTGVKFMVLAWA